MYFFEKSLSKSILYIVLINLLFVNIFFAIYIFYNYDVNPLYKKLTLYVFFPIWLALYLLSYSSARQYLVG